MAVRETGTIDFVVSCKNVCDCGETSSWSLNKVLHLTADVQVPIPIPLRCKWLRYSTLVVGCAVGNLVNIAVTIKEVEQIGMKSFVALSAARKAGLDPSEICESSAKSSPARN